MTENYQAQISTFVKDLSDLSVLTVQPAPIPEAGPGEVLAKILLAPINPTDVHQILGQRSIGATTFPQVSGVEAVAEVVKAGPDVTDFKPGQRVVGVFWPSAFTGSGTWQTYIKAPAEMLVHVPDSVPDKVAAQFVANPLTVVGLLESAAVPKGGWLLQTGAGSVLGRMLIALAKHQGTKTINVVRRSAQKQELLDLGADEVIATDKENIADRTAEITGGQGAYASLDAVGGEKFDEVVTATRRGGTIFSYGYLSGTPCHVNSQSLFYDMKKVEGWLLGPSYIWTLGDRRKEALGAVMKLLDDKVLEPLSGDVYPLKDVVKAVQRSQDVARGGKIFLQP